MHTSHTSPGYQFSASLTLFLSYRKTAIYPFFISIKVRELSKEPSLIPLSLTKPPLSLVRVPLSLVTRPLSLVTKANSKSNNKLNTTTLAPLNFDHVNDYAIQEGLTSVNTFRFFNTYKKTRLAICQRQSN